MSIRIGIGTNLRIAGLDTDWTPLSLTLTVVSSTSIYLSWIGGRDAIVERSTDGITYTVIGTGRDNYLDAGLVNNIYYYRVKGGSYSSVVMTYLLDGNTVAWYKHNDLVTVTKDGANRVSVWADRLGSGNDLLQGVGADQPLWSLANGILFDGSSEYMAAIPFPFALPCTYYLVLRQVTWTGWNYIFDGGAAASALLWQRLASPQIQLWGGLDPVNGDLAVNNFGIIRIGLDGGGNSFLRVDENAIVPGGIYINNPDGFTLGCRGDYLAGYSNIQVKEIILRSSLDDAGTQTDIYNYLKTEHGL